MSEATSGAGRAPLVIEDQGHFFTGLQTVTGPVGTSVYGTHVEYQVPVEPRDNLVLVHGGGGQALDSATADASGGRFALIPHAPVFVKNRTQPVELFEVKY